jgi:RHS repeat-associated protein
MTDYYYINKDIAHTPVCSAWDKGYRYGFNGEEIVNEISGEGMVYDLGFRHYESRLGRMFSRDPLEALFEWQSTYAYCYNNPIWIVDYKGMGGEPTTKHTVQKGESLSSLAKKNNTTVGAIKDANKDNIDWNSSKRTGNKKDWIYAGESLNIPTKVESGNNTTTVSPNSETPPLLPKVNVISEGKMSDYEWCTFPGDIETQSTGPGRKATLTTVQNFTINLNSNYLLYQGVDHLFPSGNTKQHNYWTLEIYGGLSNTSNANKPSYSGIIDIKINGVNFEYPISKTDGICNGFCFGLSIKIANYQNINELIISFRRVSMCAGAGSLGGGCAIDNIFIQTPCNIDISKVIFEK